MMDKQEQIERIISSCEGLQLREWELLKRFIDMKFDAINRKNTLEVDESISKNVMDGISW